MRVDDTTYTRKDYINRDCTHREFYSQFVTDQVLNTVKERIGLLRLVKSKDEHLNDIPLKEWDDLGIAQEARKKFKEINGQGVALSDIVCINKEAGRQLINNWKDEVDEL